jgi:primosomal protein N' (replication factor Y)
VYVQVAFNLPVKKEFTYRVPDGVACEAGCRVVAKVGGRSLAGFVVSITSEPPSGGFEVKELSRVIDAEPLFGDEQLALAQWIASMYLCSLGEALSVMLPTGRREKQLPELLPEELSFAKADFALSDEQEAGIRRIMEKPEGFFYLYGVTGSGKTEVFLRAAERTLGEGRGVIYLVPEISLTHQVTETIRSRFSCGVAVLHSGLTPSQRLAEWVRIRRGEARLVIGARSAVFSPVENLGLIILDEEHEGSYKSGSTPRYHARQVAMRRCIDSHARLVMGSATPSAEAFHLMREGGIEKITLSRRLSGGSMPEIVVVDMKRERDTISRLLVHEIHRTHAEGRQTILFLNRRGFSYFFHCRSCGYEMKCGRCSVALTYHKSRGMMLCHYCGYRAKPVDVCPECGSLDVGYSGFGTEKVEEDVARLFPDLKVFRVDTDSVKKRGTLAHVLRDFRSGKIDILLGTQMVAKGLNFPGVKLVGIILADTGLQLPDFRAAERTFSLVTQVSGRAGRYMPDGKVVIQTYKPTHEAISLAARAELVSFYERELQTREMLGFPPYSRLIRIVFRGPDLRKTRAVAAEFSAGLAAPIKDFAEILGPAECPLAVIAKNHRFQLIIRSREFGRVHAALSRRYAAFRSPADVHLEIDIDPVSLL